MLWSLPTSSLGCKTSVVLEYRAGTLLRTLRKMQRGLSFSAIISYGESRFCSSLRASPTVSVELKFQLNEVSRG